MSEPLSIKCPNCGSGLKLKDYSLIGKKVPCPKCKVPFQIAVNLAVAPVDSTAPPSDTNLPKEARPWRCPWCSKEVWVSANGPDPSSCDECRANAPRPEPVVKPTIPAVSKNQRQPAAGGQSRNQAESSKWHCPTCEGQVSEHAKKCRHCGESLAVTEHSIGISGGGSNKMLWISLGSFCLLFFACCLVPTLKKEDRNESPEIKTTSKYAAEADHQARDIQNDPINVICAYLEEDGHRTKSYRQLDGTGDDYYACSPYKDISPNSPNHIAYYVDGTRTKVSAINLDLNVSDLSGASAANGELLSSGEKLVLKATGNPLPNAAREAILAGGSGTWHIGPTTVRLRRNDYPSGRGYSLNLLIEWK